MWIMMLCYFPCFVLNVTFMRTKLDLVVSSILCSLCLLCTFSGPAIKKSSTFFNEEVLYAMNAFCSFNP